MKWEIIERPFADVGSDTVCARCDVIFASRGE